MDSVEEDPYDWTKSFLEEYGIDSSLDSIQMFHLTRRLNGTDLMTNNNLEQLLMGETPVSEFFKRKYDCSIGFALRFRKSAWIKKMTKETAATSILLSFPSD